MKKVTLITFQGCPNAEKARTALREIGAAFEDVVQDNLPPNHPHRSFSSPSILLGDEVISGSELDAGGSGCSFGLPSAQELRARLGVKSA
jgi:glutaredoxin